MNVLALGVWAIFFDVGIHTGTDGPMPEQIGVYISDLLGDCYVSHLDRISMCKFALARRGSSGHPIPFSGCSRRVTGMP